MTLRIVGPPALAGEILPLAPGRWLVGREAGADLWIDDPHVSARHAVITTVGHQVTVEDLGSSNGTWLGGERITGTCKLYAGDIVSFGRVQARLEQRQAPSTMMLPLVETDGRSPSRARFDVGDQRAQQINNVGGDQYNSYMQQRESFLREVAASRTKARHVFWVGLLMVIIGGLGYAYFVLDAMGEISTSLQTGVEPEEFRMFGPDTGVGQVGLIFFGIAFVGQFVLVIGLIWWIVAAARVRRVDTDPRYAWNAPTRR